MKKKDDNQTPQGCLRRPLFTKKGYYTGKQSFRGNHEQQRKLANKQTVKKTVPKNVQTKKAPKTCGGDLKSVLNEGKKLVTVNAPNPRCDKSQRAQQKGHGQKNAIS